VKRLALFHHDPSRTDAELTSITDRMVNGTRAAVFAAREGESVDVVTCSA
jgi:hypothetical protein